MQATRLLQKDRDGWATLDAHLRQYAPTLHAKLPPQYYDLIKDMPYLYTRVALLTSYLAKDRSSDLYVASYHGLLRLTAGLSWPEQGIPPVPRNKIVRCGKMLHARVDTLARQVYVFLEHLKTRNPELWRAAMMGWNGTVVLNQRIPGVFEKRQDVYGYVHWRKMDIAGCIFISPVTEFRESGKNRDADIVTILHELAHLTKAAQHILVHDTPPNVEDNPHDDEWLGLYSTLLQYASEDLGWRLPISRDETTPTGLRYGVTCPKCIPE